MLLRKPRSYAEVYNDLDAEVVDFFRVLRDPDSASRLRAAVELTPFARAEFAAAYEHHPDPVERARRTVIKSCMGFGSAAATREGFYKPPTGFRSNCNRSNTTPAHDWSNWPALVPAFVERLRGVVVENRPAAAVIAQQDSPDTLHYVDPPYPFATRQRGAGRGARQSYRHEMTDAEHIALAELLHGVAGMVVLSGYPCALYDEKLYPRWHRVQRLHFGDGAVERTEVLWLNPAAWGACPLNPANAAAPADPSLFGEVAP